LEKEFDKNDVLAAQGLLLRDIVATFVKLKRDMSQIGALSWGQIAMILSEFNDQLKVTTEKIDETANRLGL